MARILALASGPLCTVHGQGRVCCERFGLHDAETGNLSAVTAPGLPTCGRWCAVRNGQVCKSKSSDRGLAARGAVWAWIGRWLPVAVEMPA